MKKINEAFDFNSSIIADNEEDNTMQDYKRELRKNSIHTFFKDVAWCLNKWDNDDITYLYTYKNYDIFTLFFNDDEFIKMMNPLIDVSKYDTNYSFTYKYIGVYLAETLSEKSEMMPDIAADIIQQTLERYNILYTKSYLKYCTSSIYTYGKAGDAIVLFPAYCRTNIINKLHYFFPILIAIPQTKYMEHTNNKALKDIQSTLYTLYVTTYFEYSSSQQFKKFFMFPKGWNYKYDESYNTLMFFLGKDDLKFNNRIYDQDETQTILLGSDLQYIAPYSVSESYLLKNINGGVIGGVEEISDDRIFNMLLNLPENILEKTYYILCIKGKSVEKIYKFLQKYD